MEDSGGGEWLEIFGENRAYFWPGVFWTCLLEIGTRAFGHPFCALLDTHFARFWTPILCDPGRHILGCPRMAGETFGHPPKKRWAGGAQVYEFGTEFGAATEFREAKVEQTKSLLRQRHFVVLRTEPPFGRYQGSNSEASKAMCAVVLNNHQFSVNSLAIDMLPDMMFVLGWCSGVPRWCFLDMAAFVERFSRGR